MKLSTSIALSILALCGARGEAAAGMPTERCHWVMERGVPDWGVRIWYPAGTPNHKDCNQQKYTEAMALADVLTIILSIEHKERRFRMQKEDEGYLLIEYLPDMKSEKGERRLGRDEVIHYHGVYVDLETTKRLIDAFRNQPMGLGALVP